MAHVKHNWETGEVISAEKLNNIENSIYVKEPLIVGRKDVPETGDAQIDKTFGQLRDAVLNGSPIFFGETFESGFTYSICNKIEMIHNEDGYQGQVDFLYAGSYNTIPCPTEEELYASYPYTTW